MFRSVDSSADHVHRCTIFSYVLLVLERLLQKLGTICVCQSRTVEAGAFNSKGVPVEWCGVPPPSINYHDVQKRSWWHEVPHCSLPHHSTMMYLLPTTVEKGGVIECMCATVATLAITGCILRNNQYHSFGALLSERIHFVPFQETISSPFCYILSQGYQDTRAL